MRYCVSSANSSVAALNPSTMQTDPIAYRSLAAGAEVCPTRGGSPKPHTLRGLPLGVVSQQKRQDRTVPESGTGQDDPYCRLEPTIICTHPFLHFS